MSRKLVFFGIKWYQIEFYKPGEKINGPNLTAKTDDIAMNKKTLRNKFKYNDRESQTINNVISKKVLFYL